MIHIKSLKIDFFSREHPQNLLKNCSLLKELDNSAQGTGFAFIVMADVFTKIPGMQLKDYVNFNSEAHSSTRCPILVSSILPDAYITWIGITDWHHRGCYLNTI